MKIDLLKVMSDIADFAIEEKYDGSDFYDLLDRFRNSEVFTGYRPKHKKITNGLRGKKSWSVDAALFRPDAPEVVEELLNIDIYPETLKFKIGGKLLIIPIWQDRQDTKLRQLSYQFVCLLLKLVLGGNLISDSYEHYKLFKRYRKLLRIAYIDGMTDRKGLSSEQIRVEEECSALRMKLESNIEPGFRLWLAESLVSIKPCEEHNAILEEYTAKYPAQLRPKGLYQGSLEEIINTAFKNLPKEQEKFFEVRQGKSNNHRAHAFLNGFVDYLSAELSNRSSFTHPLFDKAEYVYIDMYGPMGFKRIHRYSRNNLVAAEVLCSFLDPNKDDYSLPCLCLCRAVESQVNRRIVFPFIDAYENIADSKNIMQGSRKANRFYLYDLSFRDRHENGRILKDQFTLSSFQEMSGYLAVTSDKYSGIEAENRKLDWKSFIGIVAELKGCNEAQSERYLRDITPLITNIHAKFRRGATHPASRLSYETYLECRNMVCSDDGFFGIELISEAEMNKQKK